MLNLSIDLETYSSVPIANAGMYKYVQSPDFEILLMAYSLDGSEPEIIDMAQGKTMPQWLYDAIQSPEYIKHAYNAPFEWCCLSKFYGRPLPVNQWRDTMLHSLYCGFTAGLDITGRVLGLPAEKQKLSTGKALIRYFCIPCKPTKVNGQRTRNLPKHDPAKWDLFKTYCKGDVVTEMEIERRLSGFPVPDDIEKQWQTDLIINARGVAVDMDLVHGALKIGYENRSKLMNEAVRLTGLQNPNSVSQLSVWLESEINETVDNLRKETVSYMLEQGVASGSAERMLEIRQELGKTSTKKYNAIESCVCEDGRVRGLLQFYGANRTGRYAGRLIQVQNLPRTHIEQLDTARAAIKQGKAKTLKFCFGSVNDTLSQLIRTTFVASPGNKLIDADFSSIEARVISWLAKENWRLEAFRNGADIYCMAASNMFGVPVEKHGANAELRQKGKIAELACIAEGQLVLTDKGLVPIEDITLNHRLWDGLEWVNHEGLIYQGEKEVMEYAGLTATPDHVVYIEGQSRPVRFDFAASSGAHLVQTGNGRKAIRVGKNHKLGKKMESELESLLHSNTVCKLRQHTVANSRQFNKRRIKRLSALFTTAQNTEMVGQKAYCCKATLRKSERSRISELWSEGDQIPISVYTGSRSVDITKRAECQAKYGDGQNRQQRRLCAREYSLCTSRRKSSKPTDKRDTLLRPARMAVCSQRSDSNACIRHDAGRNYSIGKNSSGRKTQKLARNCYKAKVYDIRNAGPRHRFTVSGCLVHNCGYGGAVGALIAMGAAKMGIPESDLMDIVARWRDANRRIVNLWYDLENAAVSVIQTGRQAIVNNLVFAREFDLNNNLDFMTIRLPSGRKLYYAHPQLGVNRWENASISYHGINQTTRQWTQLETYGGKIAENVVQAIARDCLAEAIERLEANGFPIVFHVHDEVVIDCPADKADLEQAIALMTAPISWAKDLPLQADGWIGDFYKKD
ncbi:MAG: hypothetical protein IJ667_10060 [Synergistaceae bacterium]|nr:hypothetical protein [Synergistaceae bacterium]